MEILYGVLLVFAWIGMVMIMRVVSTFLHEMGHALPALWFTQNGPVQIYVGSYGNENDSWRTSLGRLTLFFSPRVSAWNMGMCVYPAGAKMTFGQEMLTILGGPFSSVIVGGLGLWAIVSYELGEVLFIIVAAFSLSTVWDLFVNLMPVGAGTRGLHGGGRIISDGDRLRDLLARRRLPETYHHFRQQLDQENYEPLIAHVEAKLEQNKLEPSLFPLAIEAYTQTGEYGGALSIYEYVHRQQPLAASQYFTLGELYRKLNNYTEAINCYGEYLHEYYTDARALFRRAQCYQETGEHAAAVREFTVAQRYEPGHAPTYRDRAYSLLRLNEFEAAAQDLTTAAELEPDHPRLHLYRGFLQEAHGEYAAAHASLLRAQELGDDHHAIPFRLSELERRL